jgi:hypothetical protein
MPIGQLVVWLILELVFAVAIGMLALGMAKMRKQ